MDAVMYLRFFVEPGEVPLNDGLQSGIGIIQQHGPVRKIKSHSITHLFMTSYHTSTHAFYIVQSSIG